MYSCRKTTMAPRRSTRPRRILRDPTCRVHDSSWTSLRLNHNDMCSSNMQKLRRRIRTTLRRSAELDERRARASRAVAPSAVYHQQLLLGQCRAFLLLAEPTSNRRTGPNSVLGFRRQGIRLDFVLPTAEPSPCPLAGKRERERERAARSSRRRFLLVVGATPISDEVEENDEVTALLRGDPARDGARPSSYPVPSSYSAPLQVPPSTILPHRSTT